MAQELRPGLMHRLAYHAICHHRWHDSLSHDALLSKHAPFFLARNTYTPLISDSLGSLDEVNLECMCTKGTGGTHMD